MLQLLRNRKHLHPLFCLHFFFCLSSQVTSQQGQCFHKECCYVSDENILPLKVEDKTCFTGKGHDYRGNLSTTKANQSCMNWLDTSFANISLTEKLKFGIGDHDYCRNPEPSESKGPWCYVQSKNFGYCNVLRCSDYPEVNYNALTSSSLCGTKDNNAQPTDFFFMYQTYVYYVTKFRKNTVLGNYVIYKFTNDNMTSFGQPSTQTFDKMTYLCLHEHDVITFVTSGPDEELYLYMQVPHVMLKLDLEMKNWTKMRKETFEHCLDPVRQSAKTADNKKETVIRNVFNFNKPNSVFLETDSRQFECVWKNGNLVAAAQTTPQFQTCGRSSALFIDKTNVAFALSHNNGTPSNASVKQNLVTNVLKSIETKPALAAPLLDYQVLNKDSLVKICEKENTLDKLVDCCSRDGARSRIFKIYHGSQLVNLLDWMQCQQLVNIEIEINSIETKRAGFCGNETKKNSCCNELLADFRHMRKSGRFHEETKNNKGDIWIPCHLHFSSRTNSSTPYCPTLTCFFDQLKKPSVSVRSLCEIRLSSDPPESEEVGIRDILGVKPGEEIHYVDALDASTKMGEVADSIRHPINRSKFGLDVLVGSIAALQPVNYTGLSQADTEQLVVDFVMVVDNLADQERVEEWANFPKEESQKENVFTEADRTDARKKSDPHSLLFITENVLKKVTSGGVVWKGRNNSLTVTSQNLVCTIERKFSNSSKPEPWINENMNLTLSPFDANPNESSVMITSSFPNIISMIAQVYGDKEATRSPSCLNKTTQATCQERLFVSSSPVLSATVLQNNTKISTAVAFSIPFAEHSLPKPIVHDRKYYFTCTYLSKDNTWETSGCHITDVNVGEQSVHCACNHTTNFAILLQAIPPKIHSSDVEALELLSNVGESLSVLCLMITLVVLCLFRRSLHSERMVAHFHLVVALLIFHLVQVFSYNAEDMKDGSPIPCIVVVFFTHFSILASFMWMLCEGITLYFNVVEVYHQFKIFKILRYFIGWGIPLLITCGSLAYGLYMKPYPTCYLQGIGEQSCIISASIFEDELQYRDADPLHQVVERCWLSIESHIIWALIIPAAAVLMLNLFVLVRVSILIFTASQSANILQRSTAEDKKDAMAHIRKSFKGIIILMPILGIPWIFGFIPQSHTHVVFLYIFTCLNSTQGVFILLFYCILNSEVRDVFMKCLQKKKQQLNWTPRANSHRQSSDLRHTRNRSEDGSDSASSLPHRFQRSMSTNTNATYVGGISQVEKTFFFPNASSERIVTSHTIQSTSFSETQSPEDKDSIDQQMQSAEHESLQTDK